MDGIPYSTFKHQLYERLFEAANKIRIDWTDPAHRELAEALIEIRQLRGTTNMGEQYLGEGTDQ